ncbi:hypothetical protein ACQP2Y_21165 [Actinoplanes sp. CA-051413]|uniref:hypothetical protein n=1 Tax=Actinoplanes sp. CA-051413 TaxID=3239899 RepID=UPI003D98FD14
MKYRGFMLFADGRIEEVDAGGDTFDYPPEPGLYGDLLQAGYPLHGDQEIGRWDGIIDLRVENDRVIVHTSGAPPREHDMGDAGAQFLSWYHQNAEGPL